jgi:hypothetical protein
MKRLVRIALFSISLLAAGGPASAQPVTDLVQKLEQASDFRVRVQAALQLGKAKGRISLKALEAALDDENAAVRAAAAAALRVQGDPDAVEILRKHLNDHSPAVRSQIQTTIAALEQSSAGASKTTQRPDVVIQFGKIRGLSQSESGAVLDDVERASKQKLRELPGIAVVEEGKEASARRDVPVVMVTGRVSKLEHSRDGESVVYLASVEFVLHKMPGQSIKGVVSGSAHVSGSPDELEELRRTAIEAAIDSAVKRAPQALRAAAQ